MRVRRLLAGARRSRAVRPTRPVALAQRDECGSVGLMVTPGVPAFLLRYQQPVPVSNQGESLGAGTMTKTSARESSDQDVSREWTRTATSTFTEAREQADQDPARLLLATQTHTATREEVDQDPSRRVALGTQTHTDSRETSDSDPSHSGWAVIPRG